jgi:hypothetical protein
LIVADLEHWSLFAELSVDRFRFFGKRITFDGVAPLPCTDRSDVERSGLVVAVADLAEERKRACRRL